LKDWVTIDVGGVTIIDGVTATRNELADYYDLRIWFSCPRDIRVSRLLGRGDTSEAEIEHWMPSEDQYIVSHAPESKAHLVVDSAADMAAEDGRSWLATRWSPPSAA
jgi:uridine kinase